MNEHADQPGAPDKQSANPGRALQSQREAMGWTVEQVADQLKLAPRQVVALEAGDYASLPSPAVTRGFVRAYAKLLKIDAAPLVSMIELNMPPQAQAGAPMVRREHRPAAFSETRFPIGGRRVRLPLGWIASAVVVAGAAFAAWQLGVFPGSQPAADANPADGVVIETPAGSAMAPGVGTSGVATPGVATPGVVTPPLNNPSVPLISVPAPPADGGAAATAPGAGPVGAPQGIAAPGVPPGSAPVATAPAAAAAAPAAPAVPPAAPPTAGANTLVLNVREDSWIEVRPAGGGRPLVSRLVKAGSTETVELTEPVNLVVGAPAGVTATLRGANVALPQVPGRTIARVTLK